MAFSTPRPVCLPLHECLALFFTKSGVPKYSVITRLFFSVVHLFKRSVVSPALAAFCVDSVLSADLMAILVACLVCITLSVYTLVHNSCTLSLRNFAHFFQHVSRKSNLHRLERSLQIICGFFMTYQVWSRRVPHYMSTLPLKFLTLFITPLLQNTRSLVDLFTCISCRVLLSK